MAILNLLLVALVGIRPNEAALLTGASSPAARGGRPAAFSLVGTAAARSATRVQEAAQRSDLVRTKESLEFSRSAVRVASKEEIMANMTSHRAYETFLRMNRSRDASLADLLETQFGGQRKGGQSLRHVQKHGKAGKYSELEGLYTARDLLNGMMDETILNMEVESEKCENYERNQLKLIWESQQDIDYANAHAADERAAVLKASQIIATIQDPKIPNLDLQVQQNSETCDQEVKALSGQLDLVGSDMQVLRSVLGMIECEVVDLDLPDPIKQEQQQQPQTALLDLAGASRRSNRSSVSSWKASSQQEDGALVQCPACAQGTRPVVHVRHATVQKLLMKLKSEVAKELTSQHLHEAFLETAQQFPSKIRPAILIQGGKKATMASERLPDFSEFEAALKEIHDVCSEDMGQGINGTSYRGCQSQTIGGIECQPWTSQSPHAHSGVTNETGPGNDFGLGDNNYCRNPTPEARETIWCYTSRPDQVWGYCMPIEEIRTPEGVTQHECVITGQCKMGPGNCERMRDRFLTILAGVVDKFNELSAELSRVQQECSAVHEDLTGSISTLNVNLNQEQTNLAQAMKNLQEATNQENLASKAHAEYVRDYHDQMKECCDNKNGFLGELCSLEKLRGELFKMHGDAVTITDCEVSDWTDSECTAKCAGGEQERTRTTIVNKLNGTNCPPEQQRRDCNTQACPIDCQVSIWSEWTECTAMCGGGVRTRMREMKVRPKYDGEQCPELQLTEECHIESCNEDCELGDWGDWSACSKACNTGHRERRMPVKVEARGQGECPHPDTTEGPKKRLDFDSCNVESCMSNLDDNQSVVECHSKLDVVFLMDGSGSLQEYGFNQSKLMASRLLRAMVGSEYQVKVAFLMYGGPTTLEAFDKCTGGSDGVQFDVANDCGMHWVAHFTSDTWAVAGRVAELPYPVSTTMTSMALAEASTEITQGRQEADSVVVVLTDGKPMSHLKTAKAAKTMRENARLVWVTLGSTMPEDLERVKSWASLPWQDNVVEIPDLDLMTTPKALNSVMATVCPDVQ